jgi:hypothetical protein
MKETPRIERFMSSTRNDSKQRYVDSFIIGYARLPDRWPVHFERIGVHIRMGYVAKASRAIGTMRNDGLTRDTERRHR